MLYSYIRLAQQWHRTLFKIPFECVSIHLWCCVSESKSEGADGKTVTLEKGDELRFEVEPDQKVTVKVPCSINRRRVLFNFPQLVKGAAELFGTELAVMEMRCGHMYI